MRYRVSRGGPPVLLSRWQAGELSGRGQRPCRTDTASCPLNWQLYLPREWTDEPDRCRRTGVPDGAATRRGGVSRSAARQPDRLAAEGAGGGQRCRLRCQTPFRLGLGQRELACVLALTGKEVAQSRPSRTSPSTAGSVRPRCPATAPRRKPCEPSRPRLGPSGSPR
ncbi:transposase [Streptomyces flaveolus]|uniref:transposase n=1 Tax=Streptomyces flaveolus TaxID=67297 RepID=UPI0036FC7CFD